MMKVVDEIEELKRNPKKVRYDHFIRTVENMGFRYKGGKGSHRVYSKEGVKEILNFQEVNGKVKPYQIRQFLKVIEKYNMLGKG